MTHNLTRLPVLVISAHNRCNCRCAMCDIWRTTDSRNFTTADLQRQLRDIGTLGVEWVVFTGGEALMNSELFEMASTLRAAGIRVTLLTSGLLMGRYAREIATHIDDVIVSLDGPPGIHNRIRGVIDAFDRLASGLGAIRAIAPDFPMAARCTVQKANHAALVDTARAAQGLGLSSISFLAVDVSSDAFNHQLAMVSSRSQALLVTAEEIEALQREIRRLLADPVRSIVVESPAKLVRLVQHFRALAGGFYPESPVCNAPWVSAVVDQDGDVRPCFFHPSIGNIKGQSLTQVLNSEPALTFRRNLDVPTNPICRRCVCSLHRPAQLEETREVA